LSRRKTKTGRKEFCYPPSHITTYTVRYMAILYLWYNLL